MYIHTKLVETGKEVFGLRLNDEYEENRPIEQLHVVDKGSGHVDLDARILYTSGFCIKETFLSVFKKVTEHFYVEGEHVRYFFFLKGASRVRADLAPQIYDHEIGVIQRNYLSGAIGGGTAEIRSENEIRHVVMYLSRDFYLRLLGNEPWAAQDAFVQYVGRGRPENRPNERFPISMSVFNMLHDLLYSEHISTNRRYYVELKLRELFFMLHEQQSQPHSLLSTNPQLYGTLESVKAYLVMNSHNPPTIKKLARLFLLNEKKLMQDFKRTYGMTIYAYIIRLRMEKAQKMLLEDHSVNTMAAELGYRSVSHFIKTFKTYYGHTPKEALMDIARLTS